MLDTVTPLQIFFWIGKGANESEKEAAAETAQEYLRSHPGSRDLDTPIIVVKQGFEPPTFTGWFMAWDPLCWSVSEGVGSGNSKETFGDGDKPGCGPSLPLLFLQDRKSYDELKAELGDNASIGQLVSVSVTGRGDSWGKRGLWVTCGTAAGEGTTSAGAAKPFSHEGTKVSVP